MTSRLTDSPRNTKQLPDIKRLRAKAHKEQTTFAQALENSNLRHWQVSAFTENKGFKPAKSRTTLSTGKEADSYITKGRRIAAGHTCLDDGSNDFDFEDFDFGYTPAHRNRDPISLADVTIKVAKPKGIHKEYDWVEKVKPVIAMDDDLKSVFSDHDWEDIYAEQQALLKPYAKAAASTSAG